MKTNLEVKDLTGLLATFSPTYASKFTGKLSNEEEKRQYSNIILGRINVPPYQGNDLKIGSLDEVRKAHDQARSLLGKFESSMWEA